MEEMATKAQKKENSSLQRRQTDVRQEKLLSSQRYSLSELAKPLHCHGGSSSLAGLYPKLSVVQAKLVVGPADDEYEREADRVAEQAIRMPKTPVQRQADEREEEEIQTKPLSGQITHLIQRQGGEEEVEEKLQASSMIQKAGTKGGQAWPELEESLEQARGGGKPLTEGFRGRMESAFGADFGGVRIHTSNVAAQLNRAINAQAFTHGRDIYLGEGKTDLKSYNWRHLLAHELTHTIQQGESKLRNQAKMKNGSIRNNKENKADLETDQEMKIPYQESQENNSQI